MPATVMTEISSKLYSEYISCTLEITEKLDLDVFKQEYVKVSDMVFPQLKRVELYELLLFLYFSLDIQILYLNQFIRNLKILN